VQQGDHLLVVNKFDKPLKKQVVANIVEKVADVGVEHPLVPFAMQPVDLPCCSFTRYARTVGKGAVAKLRFDNG